MKLHNTLGRKVQKLRDPSANPMNVYTCGPTVYDHAHIGNLSSYIFADTLRRVLELSNYTVEHVMNYTDVDDKTIRRSRETYPSDDPKASLKKLTDHYIELFQDDMRRIGNDLDSISFVRATDSIEAMKALIAKLHEAGFAYIADDGIYFSIQAYKKSGKKYGQLLEINSDNTSEARIQNDEYDKESAHDFSLWKKQKAGEPAWQFELAGQELSGRPGWHIECSAMSREAFGQPFDIHTGGVDLIFPHHENEIAQSTAGEADDKMAALFVHNEHILVDGKKMSKSANNFFTLQDIINKGYDPLAFRLLVLQSHYRSQAHFSWDNLDAAQNRLMNYRAMADLRWQVKNSGGQLTYYDTYTNNLGQALTNDLNTPIALKIISAIADDFDEMISPESRDEFILLLEKIDELLGLQLLASQDINTAQKELIESREKVRNNKNWAQSDELRDTLKEQGIGLRDTDHGAIWYRL